MRLEVGPGPDQVLSLLPIAVITLVRLLREVTGDCFLLFVFFLPLSKNTFAEFPQWMSNVWEFKDF